MPDDILFSIKNLTVEYKTRAGPVRAVDNVTFDIYRGEILGLVGESGCGKSTLGKALMRLKTGMVDITGGELWFDGQDLLTLSDREMTELRGAEIGMVFQDPMTSLNPVQRILDHLTETIQTHKPEIKDGDAQARAEKLVEKLGIRRERLSEYPHQMSGGMRQRVMVGLGLVLNASLIIADEATTSLDVIVEAKLVDLLREIRDEFWLAILLITHNIALVAQIADRVAVMYAGKIVEIGSVEKIFDDPAHPYTQGLLQSVPSIRLDEHELLFKMPGEPPDLIHPPDGCRFHPRCPWAMEICSRYEPELMEVAPGRWVHCWLYQDHPEKERETLKVSM
jgi:oligopeptide/dipeptide ABC transporter ATP-binding protein